MKQLVMSVMLMISFVGFACDNCNVYLSQSPNDYKNSIGLYMRHRLMYGAYDFFGEMTSVMHAGHGNDPALWGNDVQEIFQTFELRGNYYFKERWKTTVIIPIVNNQQIIDDKQRYLIRNIGDPILMQSYQLYNTKKDTGASNFSQRVMVGIGVKLPVGKTNLKYEQGTPNLDLQPGSGSWDMVSYISYGFKINSFGLNAISNVKLNGKDHLNYRYGTVINGSVNLFNDFKINKSTIRILAGSSTELALKDASYTAFHNEKTLYDNTGGQIIFANMGMQFFLRKFVLFGEYQHAVSSELNGFSQLLTKSKLNVGVTYNLK